MRMDDQTTYMWMSTRKNNNINIILIYSLESLYQREFGLESSQQRVILAPHCHDKFTSIKVGMKWKRKWVKQIGQSSKNWISFNNGFFAFFYFLFPLLLWGFFNVKEWMSVSFFLNMYTMWRNFLVCLACLCWARMSNWIKWSCAKPQDARLLMIVVFQCDFLH